MKAVWLNCSVLLVLFALPNQLCDGCNAGRRFHKSAPRTCRAGYWGPYCSHVCHCNLRKPCDSSTGMCPGGECDSKYHNPSCSALKPRLSSYPPQVTLMSCPKVKIRWPSWNPKLNDGKEVSKINNYIVRISCGGKVHSYTTPNSSVLEYNWTAPEEVRCSISIYLLFIPTYSSRILPGTAPSWVTHMHPLYCNGIITAKPNVTMNGISLFWSIPPKNTTSPKYRLKSVPSLSFPSYVSDNKFYVKQLPSLKSYVFSVSKQLENNTWSKWISTKPVMMLGESERVRQVSLASLQNSRSSFATKIAWKRPSNSVLPSYFQVYVQMYILTPSFVRNRPPDNKFNVAGFATVAQLNLCWACRVYVTVSAFYRSGTVIQQAPASKTLTFSTGPGPMKVGPPKPTQPSKQGKTQIIVDVKPFNDYKDGPLEYYLAITRHSSRTRRSVSDLGLPSDARITHSRLKFPYAYGNDPMRLTIGSGSVGSINPPLRPNTAYTIYYVARSYIKEANASVHALSKIHSRTAASLSMSTGSAIAIVVGIFCLISILTIVIASCLKRRRNKSKSGPTTTATATGKVQWTKANASSAHPNQYHNAAFDRPQ